MPPSPQTAKLTSTLHLLIPRLRLLQKKSTASSVIQRRELANLLSEGRDASARIRVENVIATDISVEVLEMVELYCELILARANVLDQGAFGEKGVRARERGRVVWGSLRQGHGQAGSGSGVEGQAQAQAKGKGFSFFNPFSFSSSSSPSSSQTPTQQQQQPTSTTSDEDPPEEGNYIDPPLDEAAAAIFYAYPRFPHDVRELTILRSLLADRWGKDFMALAADNKFPVSEGVRVPERLVKGLRAKPPSAELVASYLREIARAYGVVWEGDPEGEVPGEFVDGLDDHHDGGDGGDLDVGEKGGDEDVLPTTPTRPSASRAPTDLSRVTPPRGLVQSGKSPVSVAPPGPRSDNPNPRVKVPDQEQKKNATPPPVENTKKGGIPELDELTRRFAALRR